RSQLVGARHGAEHDFLTRAVDEVSRDRRAEVGRDQELFQLFVERLVDRTIRLEDGIQARGEILLRSLEAVAQLCAEAREEAHGVWDGGRTSFGTPWPLVPSRGRLLPLNSRLTPAALPMLTVSRRFETHSRTCSAGMVSSVEPPSSVRTRIQVLSVVRAVRRYGAVTSEAIRSASFTGFWTT